MLVLQAKVLAQARVLARVEAVSGELEVVTSVWEVELECELGAEVARAALAPELAPELGAVR